MGSNVRSPTEATTPETPAIAMSPATLSASISAFFTHADTIHVQDFLSHLQLQPVESGLKGLWDRAFAEGHAQGREQGIREGEEHVNDLAITDILKIGFEKGNVLGIAAEREIWETAGHSNQCLCVSPPTTVNFSIQTDSPSTTVVNASIQTVSPQPTTATPPYTVASVQATSPLLSPLPTLAPDIPLDMPEPAHCDWADDPPPASVPLFPAPREHPSPRDFSGLRSSSDNPFASIRHRTKRSAQSSTTSSRQALYRHPFRRARRIRNSPRHYAPQSTALHAMLIPPSNELNWDADPRLNDLSRALLSLGWVRR